MWTWTRRPGRGAYQRCVRAGEVKLPLVRNLDVSYDNVQVLFGVNFEIDEGEIVAACSRQQRGQSTLLKPSPVSCPPAPAIVFDGRDACAPPHEVAERASSWCRAARRVPFAHRRREPRLAGLARQGPPQPR